jgi:phage shock protein C
MSLPGRRLYRSRKQRIIGGVCGGIGEYFGVDPVLIRLAWVLFCLVWGAGLLFYLIAWIIIPPAPDYVDVQSVPPGAPPPTTSAYGSAPTGYPGIITIVLAIFGVVLVISGISALFSSFFSSLSAYMLPAALIVLGSVIVAAVVLLMRR